MVSLIQNILTKNLQTICQVILRENQSDDCESTDDGFNQFTNHQVHLSTSRQWLYLTCMNLFFFLLLIEIISIAKLLITVHFFVLKHEKQTVTFTQNLMVIKTTVFFSNLFCGSTRFSAPTLKTTRT